MATYTNRQQAHYQQIQEQERQIRKLEYREEVAKREHQAAKKSRELAQSALHILIDTDPEELELPGGVSVVEARSVDWRETAISVAIHDDPIIKALLADEIETLGQLQKYLAANENRLTRIGGISEQMEAKALEQLGLFWEANPEIETEGDDDAVI